MSTLDFYLYFDEDQDLTEDQMPEWTPVEPQHLLELHQRGLLALRETFSHRGWHHRLTMMQWRDTGDEYSAMMWDGPSGEEHWCHDVENSNFWS